MQLSVIAELDICPRKIQDLTIKINLEGIRYCLGNFTQAILGGQYCFIPVHSLSLNRSPQETLKLLGLTLTHPIKSKIYSIYCSRDNLSKKEKLSCRTAHICFNMTINFHVQQIISFLPGLEFPWISTLKHRLS